MEKSKVKSVKFKNEFDTQNGKFYNYDVEFENGIAGVYVSKSNPQNKVIAGQELEFEVISNQYGNKIKPVQAQNNFGNKKPYDPAVDNFRQSLIVAQSSTTKVIEMFIAGKIEKNQIQATTDWIMQMQFDLAKKYQNEVNKPLEV